MWRVQLGRAIKEIRLSIRQAPEHHGVWYFVRNNVNDLRLLNQNTFFAISEVPENFEAPSMCHLIYGDLDNTVEHVPTGGLSPSAFENLLKEKVAFGLTLRRYQPPNNEDLGLPKDIVEARSYVHYMDDNFN